MYTTILYGYLFKKIIKFVHLQNQAPKNMSRASESSNNK